MCTQPFFGGKQDVETVLRKANDCELASVDAMAAAAHSLIIPLAIFRGRLGIEEAIELIRLEEDHQVCILLSRLEGVQEMECRELCNVSSNYVMLI